MEPKKYRVSATCGHSFCGHCLLGLYVHEANKIKCPLCRQDITTIFKIFVEREPAEQIDPLIEQIRNYNRLFDDNRPLLRRVIELPYVLQRIRMYIFRIDFVIFFLRSVHVIRMLFLIIGYILIPFDLIP